MASSVFVQYRFPEVATPPVGTRYGLRNGFVNIELMKMGSARKSPVCSTVPFEPCTRNLNVNGVNVHWLKRKFPDIHDRSRAMFSINERDCDPFVV